VKYILDASGADHPVPAVLSAPSNSWGGGLCLCDGIRSHAQHSLEWSAMPCYTQPRWWGTVQLLTNTNSSQYPK